jgi:hypothetical protein
MPLYELDEPTPEETALLESISQNPELFRRALVVDMISRRRRCSEHHTRIEKLEQRASYQNGHDEAERETSAHRPILAGVKLPSLEAVFKYGLLMGAFVGSGILGGCEGARLAARQLAVPAAGVEAPK